RWRQIDDYSTRAQPGHRQIAGKHQQAITDLGEAGLGPFAARRRYRVAARQTGRSCCGISRARCLLRLMNLPGPASLPCSEPSHRGTQEKKPRKSGAQVKEETPMIRRG